MLVSSYDYAKKVYRNVFCASYTSRENRHTYGQHDPKIQLKVNTKEAGNAHNNAALRCIRASLLPWKNSITYSECVSVALVIIIILIIIINIKDWTLWSVPSPELQLLAPTLLRSSNCSPSLWSVVVLFQRDSVLWHSLQVWKPVPSVFI